MMQQQAAVQQGPRDGAGGGPGPGIFLLRQGPEAAPETTSEVTPETPQA